MLFNRFFMEGFCLKRKDFFKAIANDYFEERSITLEDLKKTISSVMPVFGKLEVEITEENDDKIFIFTDVDKADVAFIPEDCKLTEEQLDMSCTLLKLIVQEDNKIQIVEHGLGMLTPANKEVILFLGSLIGKKINYN